jgi:late competence protein required for DNA uptake (superfamily II DNA/RNA helicase)
MKTWKEVKIGKGVNRPKSNNMAGMNNKESISKKIKQQKEKQQKLLKIIKDEIRKAEQFRISLDGLQKLSPSSINTIQTKREKSFNKIKDALNDLILNTKIMKNTEKQFQKIS